MTNQTRTVPRSARLVGLAAFALLFSPQASFQAAAPEGVTWLDPAGAVARRVGAFLSALPPDPPRQMDLPANLAIFTAPLPDADVLRPRLAEFGFAELRVIDLVGGDTAAPLSASG